MASKASPKPGSSTTVFSSCYLARSFARKLGDFELENALISTVAEITTSANQITTASYGAALIKRLSIAAAQTERRLYERRWLSMSQSSLGHSVSKFGAVAKNPMLKAGLGD